MERALTQRWLAVLGSFALLILMSLGTRGVFLIGQALTGDTPLPVESVQLSTGDILEILPVHDLHFPLYSWILTQERTFLEASQDRVFRTRLISPGMYTLNAEMSTADRSQQIRRIFRIEVGEKSSITTSENMEIILVDFEETDSSPFILSDETHVLGLYPLQKDILPINIDLDTQNDENGDGDTRNDTNNDDTFFYSAGSPLFLWFVDLESHDLVIHRTDANGIIQAQTLRVLSRDYAKKQGLAALSIDFIPTQMEPFVYQFRPNFPNGNIPTIPILYEWTFGDGQTSLEERPTHTYETSGTFTVTVGIKNLMTGEKIGSHTREIFLAVPETPVEEGTQENGRSILGVAFVTLLVFAVLAGGGFGMMMLLRHIQAKKQSSTQPSSTSNVRQKEETMEEQPPATLLPDSTTKPDWLTEKPRSLPKPITPPPSPAAEKLLRTSPFVPPKPSPTPSPSSKTVQPSMPPVPNPSAPPPPVQKPALSPSVQQPPKPKPVSPPEQQSLPPIQKSLSPSPTREPEQSTVQDITASQATPPIQDSKKITDVKEDNKKQNINNASATQNPQDVNEKKPLQQNDASKKSQ